VDQPAARAGDHTVDPSKARRPWWSARGLRVFGAGAACVFGFTIGAPGGWLVERVVFEGANEADAPALRHLADLRNGTTLWGVDLEAVERGVERHPWVKEARARRDWPDTVVVDVTEHRAVALLHDGGRLFVVSDTGLPFLPAEPEHLDLPHLVGFAGELGSLHPDLPALSVRHALWLVSELDRRGLVARDHVGEISFSRASGYRLQAGPAEIAFGLHDLPEQLDRLEQLVSDGLSLASSTSVDLGARSVVLVRPLHAGPSGGS
jgi:cell division protein FtsQ